MSGWGSAGVISRTITCPEGDHVLDLHAEQGPEAITRKIGKQVPVIPEVGDDDAGREQPDTGLYDTDPAVRFACPRLI